MSVLSFILKKNYQIYDLSKPKKEFLPVKVRFQKNNDRHKGIVKKN